MSLSGKFFQDNHHSMSSGFDDDFFKKGGSSHYFDMPKMNYPSPSNDYTEDKNQYEVRFKVPGYNKEDIHIELDGRTLNIHGSSDNKQESSSDSPQQLSKKKGSKHHSWSSSSSQAKSFSRSYGFPKAVKSDGITSNYKDGVLTVMVPKADKKSKRSSHDDLD